MGVGREVLLTLENPMIAARFRNLLVASLFLGSLTSALAKNTLYVDGVHGNDNNNCKTWQTACKTIGHAISLASSGDCIRVAPATYTENLTINFSLKIIGSDASTTIIDGGGNGSVVTINRGDFPVTLSKLTIRNGYRYPEGGGIYNRATLTVNHCTISGNYAGGGGGIENAGALTIDDSTISANRVDSAGGGGIENDGTLRINRSTISGNLDSDPYADGGGGIFNRGGSLVVNHSTISGNTAAGGTGGGYGGGILNGSTLVVSDSTITGNSASGSGGSGGGIFNGNTMTISGTTIVANSVEHFGGGIENEGTMTVNNSTLVENTASEYTCGCGGGGIANGDLGSSGTATINNSTLSENGAPNYGIGGGIYGGSGTVTLQNSIVANSTSGGNCYNASSNGYNLSSDNTCNFNGPGDMNNTNPKLQPLGNYGGPTQTMAIFAGSPAIDAGNPNGCTDGNGHLLKTDQRGYPRPGPYDHHGCDMGAFENQKH